MANITLYESSVEPYSVCCARGTICGSAARFYLFEPMGLADLFPSANSSW